MLRALEGQLIYFPARVTGDGPPLRVDGAASVEEVWLETGDGLRIHGVRALAADGFADLIFFHGNAGNLYDRLYNVAGLVGSGFNVLIIDYRGYGKSDGAPSEKGLYADGLAALDYLAREQGIDPTRVVLFGRSLGSTVAIELATHASVGALVVESAFTGMQDMARVHYSWLPGIVLRGLRHEFDSLAKVPGLRAPVLYVHGDRDAIVPLEMGRRLYEASPEPKEWLEIPGAGHNDTVLIGGEEYYRRLEAFVRAHVVAP